MAWKPARGKCAVLKTSQALLCGLSTQRFEASVHLSPPRDLIFNKAGSNLERPLLCSRPERDRVATSWLSTKEAPSICMSQAAGRSSAGLMERTQAGASLQLRLQLCSSETNCFPANCLLSPWEHRQDGRSLWRSHFSPGQRVGMGPGPVQSQTSPQTVRCRGREGPGPGGLEEG